MVELAAEFGAIERGIGAGVAPTAANSLLTEALSIEKLSVVGVVGGVGVGC